MKPITFQRAIKFLLTERTVRSYEELVNKKLQILDAISGQQGWCDFVGEDRWGECTNVIQNDDEAKYLFQNLFKINDVKEFEDKYGVQLVANSIPLSQGGDWREYPVDTRGKLQFRIEEKLKKFYPYQQNSYTAKGVLIVEILDPTFGGFKNDVEVSQSYLGKLAVDIDPLFQQSSFDSILLVDAMNLFAKDPKNSTYKLK